MTARFSEVGEPASDRERLALRFLVEGLPDGYTVYGNPWLVQRNSRPLEVDAVVVGEAGIYVVEIKSYHGRIRGDEHDWEVDGRNVRSPVKLNRKTAQILKSELRLRNSEARRIWVQGFIFLSHAEKFETSSPVCRDVVHTRATILGALRNVALVYRLSGAAARQASARLRQDLDQLLTGADRSRRPRRTLDGYEVLSVFDRADRYTELHVSHQASGAERLLRYYEVPPLASRDEIEGIRRRVRWESDVLQRLRHPHILRADLLTRVEGGFALPMEYFPGVTLNTWIARREERDDFRQQDQIASCVDVWRKMVGALRHAHDEGVVHRLLRPDVVWLSDVTSADPDLRVGGFELAKRLGSEETASWTAVGDQRLDFAAPEVINAFSDAGPESDQFSLGGLLGLLLAGRPLFENTLAYMQSGRLLTRPSDFNGLIPGALDAAVARMLALRPPDRFADLREAEEAVTRAIAPRRQRRRAQPDEPHDPDNLEPGVQLGDFDIRGKLGEGGLAVVYSATHRATGQLRALKIARQPEAAVEALLQEHRLLGRLHHPGIVKVGDPSEVLIPGRLVLVMEHVEGQTLRQWLEGNPDADVDTRRRFAEDLLAAVEYLEQENVTHNDLKPDNLLVGKSGLRVIDFSLARAEAGQPATGGTARYRDVASHLWSHATDRYAAALCLFELFVGRHAFGGRVRELDEELRIDESEVDPPGLAGFFRTALHHEPERRQASAHALRDGLRQALGARAEETASAGTPAGDVTAATEIHRLALSNRAVNQLRRSGVLTVGELLSLSADQVRAIHSVGRKTADEILRVQEELMQRGLEGGAGEVRSLVRPAFFPELSDDRAPVFDLPGISENLGQALTRAGLGTIGRLAGASRETVLAISGVGPTKAARLLDALRRRHRSSHEEGPPRLIDDLWRLATQGLSDDQREVLDRVAGVTELPIKQAALAGERSVTRARVGQIWKKALKRLDLSLLDEPASVLDTLLDGLGGVMPLATAAERLEGIWLAGEIDGRGLARLLATLEINPFRLQPLARSEESVLIRPAFERDALKRFEDTAWRLAESWPPVDGDVASRQLRDTLPGFTGDPAGLAARLFPSLHLMAGGELFVDYLEPRQAVELVLERSGHELTPAGIAARVAETFGGVVRCPEGDALEELLARIRPGGSEPRSILADQVPAAWVSAPSALRAAEDALRAAARSRGFRIVLTPPERHHDVGRSVAGALDAHWISFEDRWFEKHDAEMERMLRAERFAAQRKRLSRSADRLLDEIVGEEGRQGQTYVIGDTGLLGTLDALDNVRYLYDLTLSGEHGFWILVIPGRFAEKRQPFFNNVTPVWHLEGIVVQLEEALGPV